MVLDMVVSIMGRAVQEMAGEASPGVLGRGVAALRRITLIIDNRPRTPIAVRGSWLTVVSARTRPQLPPLPIQLDQEGRAGAMEEHPGC
jgi:hypothetical protein